MKVVFFHRKPRPNVNFSVESLFRFIRSVLPPYIQWEVKQLSHYSIGFFKRLAISLEAARHQRGINHVTGDVNFVAILLKKKRTVLTILDVGFMNHPNPVARLILRYFWIVFPVKRSQIITTISQATKDEVLKYVKVDPARIRVVYVPISNAYTVAPKEFNSAKPLILQVGTKPNKNVHRLIKALTGIPCTLQIIGPLDESLRSHLEESGVDYVAAQNLSDEEIVNKYREADILSFVSTYEGFGMPIVEANAVGRVVVTSNILSMPEVAGDAAHLVDPFDVDSIRNGILRVIEDDEYRERLIINGFKNKERFDASYIARQFADIYEELGYMRHDQ